MNDIVEYLIFTGKFAQTTNIIVERKLTAEAAKQRGIRISNQQLRKAAETFRKAQGLKNPEEFERWLGLNGIDPGAFNDHLETDLLIEEFMTLLFEETDKTEYFSSSEDENAIRGLIYKNWLKKNLIFYTN